MPPALTPEEMLVAALGASLVTAALLLARIGRLRRRCREADAVVSELRTNIATRRRADDEDFLRESLGSLPPLLRGFHPSLQTRHLPPILLRILVGVFRPEQAAVLLRRRAAASEPSTANRLVVAAAAPPESGPRIGTEVPLGAGELGFVGEVQRPMDRKDFAQETAINLQRIRSTTLPGFHPDLVAPMVVRDQTLGVLAIAGWRSIRNGKEMLRLIAEIGAFALDHAERFAEVRVAADVDPLTGIFNKRLLSYKLGEMLFEAERREGSLSIFLFDLDHFKEYNDVNGHQAGDVLLQTLARLVQDGVRGEDLLGRFGGEEFLLILADTGAGNARLVAEKIRQQIFEHPFANAARQPLGAVSISGGVASYPADGRDSYSLLEAADEALYAAKQRGRNRVVVAGERPA
jgi:diguanylate cyclase (GGDEF)-like protein